MSNESTVTVAGYVGSEPRFFAGESDAPDYVSFRLATTRSYYNRTKNQWVDSETTWFTVKAWRSLAKNINESLTKGDAVIVHGVLDTQKWQQTDGAPRETLVIDASSVGPNLARGTAKFRPAKNNQVSAEPQRAENSHPFDNAAGSRDFDQVARSLTVTEEGEYQALNDESLTNA